MKRENQFWFLEYDTRSSSNRLNYDYKTYKNEIELYYDDKQKKWVKRKEYTGNCYPAVFPCHSYRAARRHIRKHNEIPKGSKFRLVSGYVNYNRYLMK